MGDSHQRMSSVVIRGLTKKFTSSIFTPKYRAVSSVTIFQNFSNNQKNNNYILNKSTFTPRIPKQVVIQDHKNMSSSQPQFSANFLFRQLFDRDSCTYTYLLADSDTKEAILIDPVIDLAERDAAICKDLGLKLLFAINTHMHADHITGTGLLKKLVPGVQSVISKAAGAKADIYLEPGDHIKFGSHQLEVRATPGHTSGCVTYVSHTQGCAFTGDAVMIRGCGRTDFQEGDPNMLYDSVWNQVFSLPENFKIFPAHDYQGRTVTSVSEEKPLNPRLTKPRDEFVKIMNELGLPYPKKIDESLPANKACGLYELPERFQGKF